MTITKSLLLIVTISLLQACLSPAKLSPLLQTDTKSFWCNERYLTNTDIEYDPIHLAIAKESYIYAVASSIALQTSKANIDKIQWFKAPDRLKLIESYRDANTGFEASTFKLFDINHPNKIQEIIVAFAGSNEVLDWWANLTPKGRKHYAKAREYLQRIATTHSIPYAIPLVVSGYSLGGGLALHVIKKKQTSHLVSNAYIFNSSPKTYALDISVDNRVWALSMDREVLKGFRVFMRSLGANIAPDEQRAEGFNLYTTDPIRGHFNYHLTRSILHVADYTFLQDSSNSNSEALRILQKSDESKCHSNFIQELGMSYFSQKIVLSSSSFLTVELNS